MIFRTVLAAAMFMAASASPAAGLADTHGEVRLPPAKGLQSAYRPHTMEACPSVRAATVTPPGKIAPPATVGACVVAVASR